MKDFVDFLSNSPSIPYLLGMTLLMFSTGLFFFTKYRKIAILLLVAGGFCLRLFMIHLDPFVNMWDEQYHALVAKNMMIQPFKPVLYKEAILAYDYKIWTGNHIWLHKQPQFLWQMALSMKIFGVSAVAARIPSLLLSTLMILLIYALGKKWKDEVTAFLGALIYATGHYMLELVAGRYHTDHNDLAFVFYVTASLWAYTEYHFSRKRTWILWIGIFAGMAVLNKWLTGLLVYLFWGVAVLSDKEHRKYLRNYLDIAYSLGITLLLSMPWQVYTHIRFPLEAKWEAHFNQLHFFEVVEGHGGGFWYHFQQLPILYGNYTAGFILIGSVLFWALIRDKGLRNAGIVSILFVFLFYSLARSKMPAFTLLLAAPVYLSLGYLLKLFYSFLRMRFRKTFIANVLISVLALGLSFYLFAHEKVIKNHSITDNSYVAVRSTDNKIFRQLPQMLPSGEFVLFNCRSQEEIQIMFETSYIAYPGLPSHEDIEKITRRGYRIGVFDDSKLPERITADSSIFIISALWN